MIDLLADLGVAVVIVLAIVTYSSFWLRARRRRLHPPPTVEQINARLERELDEINKEIGED